MSSDRFAIEPPRSLAPCISWVLILVPSKPIVTEYALTVSPGTEAPKKLAKRDPEEHPEWWPELQPGASSFEEFQGHQPPGGASALGRLSAALRRWSSKERPIGRALPLLAVAFALRSPAGPPKAATLPIL